MNTIKSTSIKTLVVGDVFMTGEFGPYVVVEPPRIGAQTVVVYRSFRDGLPRGTKSEFYRASLSTVIILDRFYGPELYTRNEED
jgi:hypothetical protein